MSVDWLLSLPHLSSMVRASNLSLQSISKFCFASRFILETKRTIESDSTLLVGDVNVARLFLVDEAVSHTMEPIDSVLEKPKKKRPISISQRIGTILSPLRQPQPKDTHFSHGCSVNRQLHYDKCIVQFKMA